MNKNELQFELGSLLKNTGEILQSLAYDTEEEFSRKAERSITYIKSIASRLSLDEEKEDTLTKKECALAQVFHTFLRKDGDTGLSSVLYRYIKEKRGRVVYVDFIKWMNGEENFLHKQYDLNNMETLTMYYLLKDLTEDKDISKDWKAFRKQCGL